MQGLKTHRKAQGEEPHLGGGSSCLQRLALMPLNLGIVRSQVARQQREALLPGRVRHWGEHRSAPLRLLAIAMALWYRLGSAKR